MGLTVQNMADFRGGPCTVEHGAKEILQSASRPVESKYMAKLVVIQGLHSNPWEGWDGLRQGCSIRREPG